MRKAGVLSTGCCGVVSGRIDQSPLFHQLITAHAVFVTGIPPGFAVGGDTVPDCRTAYMVRGIFPGGAAGFYHFAAAEAVGVTRIAGLRAGGCFSIPDFGSACVVGGILLAIGLSAISRSADSGGDAGGGSTARG